VDAVRNRLVLDDLPAILGCLEKAFAIARDEIDALNVFPVPDGDTGTNLLLTVRSALDALDDADDDTSLCDAAGRGAVLGARGNSGVIFSQVIRALCEQLADDALEADDAMVVLRRARDLAYDAVADPVGGTILSAMDAAADVIGTDGSLLAALDAAVSATGDAVAATRDQLEQNRTAGVVDAGARGFEVALQAMRAYVAGEDPPPRHPPPVRRVVGDVVVRESGSLEFEFEVQFLLEADDDVAPTVRRALEAIGDSVVVVACGGLLNVHVHTNDIGAAIEVGSDRGHVFRVQVTSFSEQIAHLPMQPGADAAAAATRPQRGFGVVAVLPGRRLGDLAREDGAVVVDAAAGALPTVANLVDAVRRAHADRVAILPGHHNAVPTARKAAELAREDGLDVTVVAEAVSVPAVLAALAMADPDDGVADDLRAAAADVRAGEVVAAVRDADTPVGPVAEGQYLVVVGTDVVGYDDDPVAALQDLVARLCAGEPEVVTVLVGQDVAPAESHRAATAVERVCGDAEIDILDGGQRPARYVVGVE
jgi:DAK2 domain fusion protein YloV